jgi:multidrug efflux pump subunit AcrA (membrane-fusion protein)
MISVPKALVFAAAVPLLLASCAPSSAEAGSERELRVRRGDLVRKTLLTGDLQARQGETITVPRSTSWQTTIQWLAEDGIDVAEGEEVAVLDTGAVTSNIADKRTSLQEARHQLAEHEARAKAEVTEKEFELERRRTELQKAEMKVILPRDLIPAREAEENELAYRRAEKELAKAFEALDAAVRGLAADRRNLEIGLSTARDEIEQAERTIETFSLRAPAAGLLIIGEQQGWEGRKLQVGDRVWVNFPVATIPDLATLHVVANLWDVDDGRIAVGDRVTVTVDAFAGKEFGGRVASIAPVAQESGRQSLRRAFRTVVELDEIDRSWMRPGLSAKVVVSRTIRENALLVAREAVGRTADGAFVLAGGKRREVKLGPCNSFDCVVESGLDEGARVTLPGGRS